MKRRSPAFPRRLAALALNGAEYIVNPLAAVASGCNIGKFHGQSHFVSPRGQIEKEASRDKDGLIVPEMDGEWCAKCATLYSSSATGDRKPMVF